MAGDVKERAGEDVALAFALVKENDAKVAAATFGFSLNPAAVPGGDVGSEYEQIVASGPHRPERRGHVGYLGDLESGSCESFGMRKK